MKNIKKRISLILSVALLTGIINIPVFAADSSGIWGNLKFYYKNIEDEDGEKKYTLIFGGTGEMKTAPSSGYDTIEYNSGDMVQSYRNSSSTGYGSSIIDAGKTENIDFEENSNVTSIGDYAFQAIPDNGTFSITPFSRLESVNFPDSITSIGEYAFYNTPLEEVLINNTKCTEIKNNAFENCKSLYYVAFSPSLKKIGDNAFKNDNHEDFEILNFSDTTLESIGKGAFCGCTHLSDVTFEGSNLESIGSEAFRYTAIYRVTLPKGVSRIEEYTFADCTELTVLDLPGSLSYIDTNAFSGCTNINVINFNGTYEDWEKIIDGRDIETLFGNSEVTVNCSGSGDVNVKGTLRSGIVWEYKDNPDNTNESYILNFSGDGGIDDQLETGIVTGEENVSFRNMGTDVNNPGSTGDYRRFAKYTEKIVFSDAISEIGSYAFYSYPTDYRLFYYLNDVKLPYELSTVGKYAFSRCVNLPSFKVTGDKLSRIEEGAFSGCKALKEVDLGNLIMYIGNDAFKNCEQLSSINLPAVKDLGEGAFQGCTSLSDVRLGSSLAKIPKNAFLSCTGLKELYAPGKTTFDEYSLANCTSLTSLHVGEEVEFKDYALANCDNLTAVYYDGTRLEWKAVNKGAGNTALKNKNCYIYCEDGIINDNVPSFATINSNNETIIFKGQKIDPSLIFSDIRDIFYYKTGSKKAVIIDPEKEYEKKNNSEYKESPSWKKERTSTSTYLLGKKTGTTKLSCYDEKGNTLESCTVKIYKRPKFKKFKTNLGDTKIYPGDTISGNNFIKNCPEYPEMFTWESSDIDVATVSPNGIITAKSHGKTTISLMYGTWVVRSKTISVKRAKSNYQIITES